MKTLEECLEIDSDSSYAANNYIRVLISIGRNKDAKQFIKLGKYKVSKSLCDKVSKLDNTNARIKKPIQNNSNEQEYLFKPKSIDSGIKRQQFSSERLLEEELTLRLES